MPEGLVLTMDGSTRACGVALVAPVVGRAEAGTAMACLRWRVVHRRIAGEHEGGARCLLRLVDGLLSEAEVSPWAIRAVVVGTGPGTFTGVRLAVATARALALSLRRPVLGVCTLGALAARAALEVEATREEAKTWPQRIVSFVDARRGQLFYAVYEALWPQTARDPKITDPQSTGAALEDPGLVLRPRWRRIGDYGVCDCAELTAIAGVGAKSGLIVGEVERLSLAPPAGWGGVSCAVGPEYLVLGQELLVEPQEESGGYRTSAWLADAVSEEGKGWPGDLPGRPGTPEAVKPIYVRSPDADLHITKMRDPWA